MDDGRQVMAKAHIAFGKVSLKTEMKIFSRFLRRNVVKVGYNQSRVY